MNFLRFVFRSGKGGFALGILGTLALIFAWNYLDYRTSTKRISETKAAGLAALRGEQAWSPLALWRQPRLLRARVVSENASSLAAADYLSDRDSTEGAAKKIIRKAQIQMTAGSPLNAMNRIRDLSDQYQGIVISAKSQDADKPYAEADIAVDIPADQLDAFLAQVRQVATQLSSDQVEATDVSKQYVDEQAEIKNLKAQEEQYRQILKNAHKVEDVMSVTEKLDEVRAQIDTTQANLKSLAHDVAMSSVRVDIRRDTATARFYHWRPVQQIRESASDMVEGFAGVFNAVIAMLFYIPILLVWLLLLMVASVVVTRYGKKVWKRLRPLYG